MIAPGYIDMYFSTVSYYNTSGTSYVAAPLPGYLVLNVSPPFDEYGCKYITILYGKPYTVDGAVEVAESNARYYQTEMEVERTKLWEFESCINKVKNTIKL